ncbi:MAG: hypothetical protein CMB80_27285 [Flammeovirgaceae bacterium]|nr:hypothetical protein [Flammeovirgaceae bacterium]HCX24896.1 hypothetical protein [Cytophagales bacterium]
MNLQDQYHQLLEAYSDDNLNRITGKLILLYKNKNYGKIRELVNRISKFALIEEENDARCFSRLMMLYHPDKGQQIRNAIEQMYLTKDAEGLKQFSHVLLLDDMDQVQVTTVDEDVDYQPEFQWDVQSRDGFSYDGEEEDTNEEEGFEKSFYNLIKIREYGRLDVEFPTYYLEDFEEFEMAYSDLETLDGVQYCKHVRILDASNNQLTDIEELWGLENLEELYLANNQIGYIDALSNLANLKMVDLSGNEIDDITPLFELEHLEFVNLLGNQVPSHQIQQLMHKGVMVMTETVVELH